jgi:hypothetical protein
MKRFKDRLVGGLAYATPLLLLGAAASGCDEAQARDKEVAVQSQAQSLDELAEMCGLTCPSEGIVEGNASIAFFGSVAKFEATAAGVASGIDAELQAIRGEFGIAADADLAAQIMAQADLYAEGGVSIDYEPAQCRVDAQATLEAQAECDAEFEPGSAMVRCEGSCEVEASADVDCGAEATLQCTLRAPSIACEGQCKGSCTVEGQAAASCEGTCNGTCDGTCSLMNSQGECAGQCDGTCEGSCELELDVAASCEGTCEGECTVTDPEAGCEGGIRASCEAEANAMVDCQGSCDGQIEPPMAKAECQASAKADASLSVECTPPSVQIDYELAVGGNVDVEAQARFEAGMRNLKVRLPKLLAAVRKAELVADAGASLAASADGAVRGSVQAAVDGDLSLRQSIGLGCALTELDDVGGIVTNASTRLEGSLSAATSFTAALGG